MLPAGGVRLIGQDDRCRIGIPGDVVDVSVGVVTGAPFAEPDRLPNAKIRFENPFVSVAVESRVSRLNRREKTFFGDEQGTLAIRLDRAAFEHDAPAVVR